MPDAILYIKANMTIKIGDISLDGNVILAPLSGVTDLPFRKLVKRFGASLVVSEMRIFFR